MKFLRFLHRVLPRLLATEKLAHLFTLVTITLSLTILGGITSITLGLVTLLERYSNEESLILFLAHDTPEQEIKAIVDGVKHRLPRAQIRLKMPREVAQELARIMGMTGGEELKVFSPWTVEVKAQEGISSSWVTRLSQHPRVLYADTGTMERERLKQLVQGAHILTTGMSLFLLLLLFFIIASTMVLLLNRRREEIELMDLLGAPHGWIYGTYAALGAIHGGMGGVLAIFLLYHPLPSFLNPWMKWLGLPALPPPTFTLVASLVGLGTLLGKMAALAAVRNFLHRRWY